MNQIDQKPVAAFRIDGGGADGPRGFATYSARGKPRLAGYRAALRAPILLPMWPLSGCLTVSEPKLCHGRFWRVVRAWSMITGDVQTVDI